MSYPVKLVLPPLKPNARNVINLPKSNTLFKLMLNFAFTNAGTIQPTLAQWPTYLTRIELLIDGHRVWDVTGTNYLMWLQRIGYTSPADGILDILFYNPYSDIKELREYFALGTADLQSVQLALTFGNYPIVTSEMVAEVGPNAPIGTFIGFTERPIYIGATGDFDFKDLPSGPQFPYATRAVHFSTANIDDVTMFIGATNVGDYTAEDRESMEKMNGITPQAGFTTVDFMRHGDPRDVFPMGDAKNANLTDVRMRLAVITAAPGNVTALHEYIQDFSKYRRPLA